MKFTLELEFVTLVRNEGTRGAITMFTRTVETGELTQAQSEIWNEDNYIGIDGDAIRPRSITWQDEERTIGKGYFAMQLSPNQDSLEDYRKLLEQGWKPNKGSAKAIQNEGYPNFKPEEF